MMNNLIVNRNMASLIKSAGMRPTRQRIMLAKLLFKDGDRHVTADGLYKEVVNARQRISLATIYNTLHQFTAAKLLKEVVIDAERTYFDTNVSPHHHFFHEESGELEDISIDKVEFKKLPHLPFKMSIKSVEIIIKLEKS